MGECPWAEESNPREMTTAIPTLDDHEDPAAKVEARMRFFCAGAAAASADGAGYAAAGAETGAETGAAAGTAGVVGTAGAAVCCLVAERVAGNPYYRPRKATAPRKKNHEGPQSLRDHSNIT